MSFTKIKNLYITVNHVVAELGKEGKIDRPNILVEELMMALHAIDQGEFKPNLFDRAQEKLEINAKKITQLQAEVEALEQTARYETDVATQSIADFNAMKSEVEVLRRDAAKWQLLISGDILIPASDRLPEHTILLMRATTDQFGDIISAVADEDDYFEKLIIDAAIAKETQEKA
jgi:FtsZ-binding cell division protein ZapB